MVIFFTVEHSGRTKSYLAKEQPSVKLTDNCQRLANWVLPVYLLQPLAGGEKIKLFKCLQTPLLLRGPFPVAMRGFPFPVCPVSGTTGPEAGFHNRTLSNLKLLRGTQLNFKTKRHNSSHEEIHLNHTYLKKVYENGRFLDKCLLFLSILTLINLSTVWTQEHCFKHI